MELDSQMTREPEHDEEVAKENYPACGIEEEPNIMTKLIEFAYKYPVQFLLILIGAAIVIIAAVITVMVV